LESGDDDDGLDHIIVVNKHNNDLIRLNKDQIPPELKKKIERDRLFNSNTESFGSNGFIYDPYNDIRPITAPSQNPAIGSSAKKKKKAGKVKEGSSAAYEKLK
jgi:hypothetical protein